MDDDPGWWRLIREALGHALMPWKAIFRSRESSGVETQLESLRLVFIALTFSLWLVGGVLELMPFNNDGSLPISVVVVVAAVGVLSLAGVHWLASRPLSGADPAAVSARYTRLLFIQVGIAETAALVGFVFTFLSGSRVAYAVGLAFAMIGFFDLAPSKRNIERRQEQLYAQGSSVNLLHALLGPRAMGQGPPD